VCGADLPSWSRDRFLAFCQQALEVSPIGRAGVATESFRKGSCSRRAELLIERLGMLKPDLEVEWRRFYNKCRIESLAIHRGDCVSSQIVDQTGPLGECKICLPA